MQFSRFLAAQTAILRHPPVYYYPERSLEDHFGFTFLHAFGESSARVDHEIIEGFSTGSWILIYFAVFIYISARLFLCMPIVPFISQALSYFSRPATAGPAAEPHMGIKYHFINSAFLPSVQVDLLEGP